jgi:hypothetical protein
MRFWFRGGKLGGFGEDTLLKKFVFEEKGNDLKGLY